MVIVIEAAVEAAGELLSAGIDAVVDKAVKHKSDIRVNIGGNTQWQPRV